MKPMLYNKISFGYLLSFIPFSFVIEMLVLSNLFMHYWFPIKTCLPVPQRKLHSRHYSTESCSLTSENYHSIYLEGMQKWAQTYDYSLTVPRNGQKTKKCLDQTPYFLKGYLKMVKWKCFISVKRNRFTKLILGQ